GARVVADRGRGGEADQEAESEQETDGSPLRPLRREVHGQKAPEGREEKEPAPLVGDVAADVRAEGEQPGGDRDEAHRLADQGPFLVTCQRRLENCGARFHHASCQASSASPRISEAASRSFSSTSTYALPENTL